MPSPKLHPFLSHLTQRLRELQTSRKRCLLRGEVWVPAECPRASGRAACGCRSRVMPARGWLWAPSPDRWQPGDGGEAVPGLPRAGSRLISPRAAVRVPTLPLPAA